MDFLGKTAIVTGASGGLGGAIALSLGRRGMDCVCHYHHNAGAAQRAADEIRAMGRKAVAVGADLASADAAALLMAEARKLGPVRVVVNSASIFAKNEIGTLNASGVSEMLAVNLTAPMLLCDAFARYLKKEGVDCQKEQDTLAAIINMVDVAGVKPWGGYSAYCASRAGLIGLTKSLAKELAPAVTVNAIAPGIVTWPGKMDPAEEQKQLKMIPAGRFGTPEDVTRTIGFLLDNDYITGQVLCVDGGRTI
jgi:NAD(P)-dependent dehydrogenase (short-subunit alcohol dehydrogenase family)